MKSHGMAVFDMKARAYVKSVLLAPPPDVVVLCAPDHQSISEILLLSPLLLTPDAICMKSSLLCYTVRKPKAEGGTSSL
jgi:hypothetical protein